MRHRTRAERNGFGAVPLDLHDPRLAWAHLGRAPRRTGAMGASESNKRLPPHPDDRRAARRAQRAARRVTRARS